MDEELLDKKELWNGFHNIKLTEAENIIKTNLNGCARNFVAIGYYLKDIRDNKTFEQGGYSSIWEYAEDKLQMSKSTVSRFMAINDRFSVDGNTPVLLDEYKDFGSGKLQEMLTLSDEQVKKVKPETTVKEIREMKKPKSVTSCDAQQLERVEGEVVGRKEESIDELDLSVTAYNNLCKAGIRTVNELCQHSEKELLDLHKMGDYYVNQIKDRLSNIGLTLKREVVRSECIYDKSLGCSISGAKDVAIGLGLDCKGLCCYSCQEDCGARCNHSSHERSKQSENASEIGKIVSKEIESVAKQDNIVSVQCEETMQMQPELPILRNNDQRKEFIDTYMTWPIWIDQSLTGEKYYRYNISDKVAMVVKVSLKHEWKNYKESKDLEYSAEQYYLLGIKSEWNQKGSSFIEDSSRTFYECSTNRSTLVEYLKEIQKGAK